MKGKSDSPLPGCQSHVSPTLSFFLSFFYSHHSNGYEVAPNFELSQWLVILRIFPTHLLGIYVSSLQRHLIKAIPHFKSWAFFLFLSYHSLYILYINPLSDIWHANIFSHPVQNLFTLCPLILRRVRVFFNFSFLQLSPSCPLPLISQTHFFQNFSFPTSL